MTHTTCSWCHAPNPAETAACAACGHDAQQPRLLCQCRGCRPQERARRAAATCDRDTDQEGA